MTQAALEPLAPETPVPPRPPARAPRSLRDLFATLALVFLMLPPLLAIAGVSGGPLERERTAQAPDVGDGWDALDQAGSYLTQRLPFRAAGVDANTWIANNVWGEAPDYGRGLAAKALPFEGVQAATGRSGGNNQTGGAAKQNSIVSTGPGNWLFLQGEFDTACRPPVKMETALARWTRLVRELRDSGRKVVLLVAPDKSSVYPEHVNPEAPGWACAQRNKKRFWDMLAAQRDPDIVPLLQPLLEQKRRDPAHRLYLRLNTHWNGSGSLLVTKTALEHVGGPVQVAPADIHYGVRRYPTDVGAFVGLGGQSERARFVQLRRHGESPIRNLGHTGPGVIGFAHPGAPGTVIPGKTLFLHDSFGDGVVPMLPHYASRLAFMSFTGTDPRLIAHAIEDSDTVIMETVERDFYTRAAVGHKDVVVTPEFLRSLKAGL